MQNSNSKGENQLPRVFFDAVQYFAHSGDVGCLLAPQRMLLGIHNANGDTALHTALLAEQNQAALAITRVMNAEDLDILNADGQSPLHIAATSGNTVVAEALVKKGARLDVTDSNGNTALHLASSVEVLRAMLRSATADAVQQTLLLPNDTGLLPLHLAASKGRIDMVLEYVARHNADVNVSDIASGRTPLHHAVRANSRPCVELLLEFEANVNAVDFDGNTPLHAAVQYDLFEITKLLIDFGADCVHSNKYFQTPLDLAVHYGSIHANSAILTTPSIRVPSRNLFAVASSIFPTVQSTPTQQVNKAPAPVSTEKLAAPVSTPAPLVSTTTSTTTTTTTSKLPSSTSAPMGSTESTTTPRHRVSEPEWQLLSNEDIKASDSEMEWHMHKNKKFTQTIKVALARKMGKDKDKEKDNSSSHGVSPHQRFREMTSRGVTASLPSIPSNAKAEKARLAAHYGTPEVSVGPSNAKNEKKALEQKYNPKIELEVTGQKSTDSSTTGVTKAAEVAAQAALQQRPHHTRFDELSTLD